MQPKQRLKKYYLGPTYPDIYLSRREAECMAYCLQGYSNQKVAKLLKISSSTVNSYVVSMKSKLNCKSKISLVAEVCQTHFIDYLEELLTAEMEQKNISNNSKTY